MQHLALWEILIDTVPSKYSHECNSIAVIFDADTVITFSNPIIMIVAFYFFYIGYLGKFGHPWNFLKA